MSFGLYNIALDEIFLRLVYIFYVCNFLIKVNAKIMSKLLECLQLYLGFILSLSLDEEQVLRGRS